MKKITKQKIGFIFILIIAIIVIATTDKIKIKYSGIIISIIILFSVFSKYIFKNTLLGRLGIGTLSFPYNLFYFIKNKLN